MELKKHLERYSMVFEQGSETNLFRAIIREDVSVAERENRVPTEEDILIANWPDRMGRTTTTTSDPHAMLAKIINFCERTGEITDEIPAITRIPRHENPHVGGRYKLKNAAQALADEFEQKLEEIESETEPEKAAPEVDKEVSTIDDSVWKGLEAAFKNDDAAPDSGESVHNS